MAAKKKVVKKVPEKKGRGLEWTFPKNSLEDAIMIAKALEEKNAGKPMPATDLPKAVGFRKATDWRFRDLLRSANLYGLVTGSGEGAIVTMQKNGADIVAPSSPAQRQQALLAAFNSVQEFKKVVDHYSGKRMPEDEYFENTLVRDFDIARDRVEKFIEVFKANVEYLNLFRAKPGHDDSGEETGQAKEVTLTTESSRVREFLDTCFVMMPFGHWFDRYYNEVYIPAIKDAGLEPVRADGLFSTGSVVEQIWEQVKKAKVLLADLTGKNANVFYELGLAHAAFKPVVLAATTIDDVPFDLRHLRVITYECREPQWDAKLRKHITAYLKAAKSNPAKSIPQPFRDGMPDEDTGEPEEAT